MIISINKTVVLKLIAEAVWQTCNKKINLWKKCLFSDFFVKMCSTSCPVYRQDICWLLAKGLGFFYYIPVLSNFSQKKKTQERCHATEKFHPVWGSVPRPVVAVCLEGNQSCSPLSQIVDFLMQLSEVDFKQCQLNQVFTILL